MNNGSVTLPIDAYMRAVEWFDNRYDDSYRDIVRFPDELYIARTFVTMIFTMDRFTLLTECFKDIKPEWDIITVNYSVDDVDYNDPKFFQMPKTNTMTKIDTDMYNIFIYEP